MPIHEYTVDMHCGGCSKAVNSVLTKTPGVEKVTIDLTAQSVVVEGSATNDEILAAIKKTGKKVTPKN